MSTFRLASLGLVAALLPVVAFATETGSSSSGGTKSGNSESRNIEFEMLARTDSGNAELDAMLIQQERERCHARTVAGSAERAACDAPRAR